MLTFNKSYDGGTFEESTPQPISYKCLVKMAQNALWAERMYIELDMPVEARRYARIWSRIFKAMCNPVIFKR